MENLFYNISQVLGITIIHSLWQGLTIYVVLSLVLQFLPDMSAASKYKLAFTALSVMLLWFAYTLYFEVDNYTWIGLIPSNQPLTANTFIPISIEQWHAPADRYYFIIARYLPYITIVYLAGLLFNTLKMLMAWNNIHRIRQTSIAAGFQQQVNQLIAQTGIRKYVKVAFSNLIDVPCITGFIKPIILLPYGISTYLTAQEIEAILLHELAHIKRNDYLLNLIQQAIGILLFFNPFSRLINRIINTERENSCDDAVVRTTGSPLIYAQALLKLEQNKRQELQLALAATGKKYHLLQRIERIMKTQKNTVNIRPVLIALVLLTFSLSSIAMLNPKIEQGKLSVKTITTKTITNLFIDTLPKAKVKSQKPAAVKSKPAPKKSFQKNGYLQEIQVDDPKMDALAAEIEKHANAIDKYYNSPEFEKMQADIDKKSAELDAYYNNPKLKRLQEDMEKKSAEFDKLNDNPEIKKLQEQLEANGKKIEKYYNSPESTKKQKELARESELLAKSEEGSAAYKQHMENIQKLSAEFSSYNNNPAMKEQIELSKKLAKQVSGYYQTPEYAKQRDDIRAYGDSMRQAYQSPKMKEQQEAVRELGKAMRDYQNKPEIAREKEQIKQLQEKIRVYQNSPEFKKKLKEARESTAITEQTKKEIAEAREQAEIAVKEAKKEQPGAFEKAEPVKKVKPVAPQRPEAEPAKPEAPSKPVDDKKNDFAKAWSINNKYDDVVATQSNNDTASKWKTVYKAGK